MTEAQFIPLAKGMKAVYADPKFLADKDAIMVWYALLKDLDYTAVSKAITEVLRTSKFPPTVADITERVHRDAAEEDLSEMEAWDLVRRAMRNSIYHSEEEFDRLPDAVKKAIGSAANLQEMAMMDEDTVESVEQSHFVRSFRVITERRHAEEKAQLPQFIRALEQKTLERLDAAKPKAIEERPKVIEVKEDIDFDSIEERIRGMWHDKD